MKKLVLAIAVSLVSFVATSQDSLTKIRMAENDPILLDDYNKSNKPLIDYILRGFNEVSNLDITEFHSEFLFSRLKRYFINDSIVTQKIAITTNPNAPYFSFIESTKDSVFIFLNGKTISDIEINCNSYILHPKSKSRCENDNLALYITLSDDTHLVYHISIYDKKISMLTVVSY
jgi:hypothetical protein